MGFPICPYYTVRAYRLYQTGRIRTGTEGTTVHYGTCQRIYYTGHLYTPGLFTDSEKDGKGSGKYNDRIKSGRRGAY